MKYLNKILENEKITDKIIIAFSIGILITSAIQITAFNFEHYKLLFKDLPKNLILLRFLVSWGLRIISILAAIGLLLRINLARLALIAIFIFTIMTVYLKHPYSGFLRHTEMLDKQFAELLKAIDLSHFSFKIVALPASIIAMLLDIFFALLFIYVFTSPHIKQQFKK